MPWALVVLVLGTIFVMIADLDDAGVDVLGPVPAGPPALTWPMIDWTMWLALIPSAMALTLVTTAEGLLVSRSYGEKRGYTTRPNRDLFAFGSGEHRRRSERQLRDGFLDFAHRCDGPGRFAHTAPLARSSPSDTLLLLLFGTALLADIPSPAIGAIVAVAILPLLGIREFIALWRLDRFEFAIGAVCFLVTLFIGAIPGILVAFVLALINLAKRAANPAIDVLAANDSPADSLLDEAPAGSVTAPGVIVIRLAAPLFFANGVIFSQAVQRAVAAAPAGAVHSLVVDMEAVTDVDVTGAEAFTTLKKWLVERDISLSFSRVRSEARERLMTFGLLEDETVYPTNRAAIEALVPPVGWRERLRERLFPHAARPEQPQRADADREPSDPPTEPIHITRSSN